MPASGRWIRRRGFTFGAAAPICSLSWSESRWRRVLQLWHREAIRIGAIMVALIVFVVGTTLFLAREIGRRAAAEDRLEELATTDALTGLTKPAQVRSRDRRGVAARSAQQHTGRDPDDRCRSFQSLQRHLWTSGRRPGSGRHRDLHFGLGAAGRRLSGAIRRRGVRGAVAGTCSGGSVRGRRNHPAQGRSNGRKIPKSPPSASAWRA